MLQMRSLHHATNEVSSSFIQDPLFKEVMSFLRRDWEIYTSHTYKEGNQCVNWLANQALSMDWNSLF